MHGAVRHLSVALVILSLASAIRSAADVNSRPFPDKHCKFTLPGIDWKWDDNKQPSQLFGASGPNGLVVVMTVTPTGPRDSLNQPFIDAFEAACFKPGLHAKRSGDFVDHRGQSSYQCEGTFATGQSSVCRIFLGHGNCYALMVIGNEQPVERLPEFEAIVNSFELDTVPLNLPAMRVADEERTVAFRVGEFAGRIIVLTIIIGFIAFVVRKART